MPARMRCVRHLLDGGSAVTAPRRRACWLWHAPDLRHCRLQNLRAELFARILRQPIEFFDDAEVGVLTSRLGNDCQARRRKLCAAVRADACHATLQSCVETPSCINAASICLSAYLPDTLRPLARLPDVASHCT
jgi:hypothetical protein